MMQNKFLTILSLFLVLVALLAGCTEGNISNNTAPKETVPEPTQSATDATNDPTETKPERKDDDFVRVRDYIPDLFVDIRYGTENNFTGSQIYDFHDAYLRLGTVRKLTDVQEKLKTMGLSLKIWDAFRPVEAQFKLWAICPDSRFVSDPNKGFSSHSRGNTVDITLVRADSTEIEMPTDFDDFTAMADRDYSDCTEQAAKNAKLLEDLMTEAGFKPYHREWWHFSDSVSYEVDSDFCPQN